MLGPTNRCARKKIYQEAKKNNNYERGRKRRKQEAFLHEMDSIFNCHILCEIRETISSVKDKLKEVIKIQRQTDTQKKEISIGWQILLEKIMAPSRDGKSDGVRVAMTSSPRERWFGGKKRRDRTVTQQLTTCAGERRGAGPAPLR